MRVKETTKPLPTSLRVDRLTNMPIACRFGWHQWAMLDRFGSHGFDYYQAKQCCRCARFKWVNCGFNAHID